MEVLLMSDVPDLGKAGAVVKVTAGYARNYLLPHELAAPVTPVALKRLEKLRKQRDELAKLQLAEAQAKAAKVENTSVTIRARTIDDTKLYGSVTAADVAQALAARGVALDRTQIVLDDPLKETGKFDVSVRLHPDVLATVKVWIVKE